MSLPNEKTIDYILVSFNCVIQYSWFGVVGYWMNDKKITPHKGGRTERISVRCTPECKAALEQMTLQGWTMADAVERIVLRVYEEDDWRPIDLHMRYKVPKFLAK